MYLLLIGSNLAFRIGELSGVSQYRQEKIQKEFQMETYKSNNSLFAVIEIMWQGSTKKWSINNSRCHNISLNFHSTFLKLIFHLWTPKNAITLHVTISTYLFVFTFQLSVNTIMIREATSSHLLWDYDPPTFTSAQVYKLRALSVGTDIQLRRSFQLFWISLGSCE